jgi:GMP synthase (glutamine-hydrolysing)
MCDYEIGYRESDRVADSRLLSGLDDPFVAFTTHQVTVTELPPGATPIAENDYGNHGFELGDVFTVQFHPEYDMETARHVASGKPLAEEKMARVMDGINEANFDAACEAKVLFDNLPLFVAQVEQLIHRDVYHTVRPSGPPSRPRPNASNSASASPVRSRKAVRTDEGVEREVGE